MSLTRRNLLGATAAVAVWGMPAGAHTIEPLLAMEQALIAQRDVLIASLVGTSGQSQERFRPQLRRIDCMERKIYRRPARSPLGVAVKLRLWHRFYAEFSGANPQAAWWRGDLDSMGIEELGFACVMLDLEHLAGEKLPIEDGLAQHPDHRETDAFAGG